MEDVLTVATVSRNADQELERNNYQRGMCREQEAPARREPPVTSHLRNLESKGGAGKRESMSDKDRPHGSEEGSALLQRFAEVAEAISATSKKLEKASLLGTYFQGLNDSDLPRAARYFAGHQFALSDSRTTNVGGRIISDALSQATGFGIEDLLPRYVRLGDAGEAAYEVVKDAKREFQEPLLTLAETESIIARLSDTRGTKNKTALLATVLH
ncbi:MAG: hypothetical protein ACRD8U_11860, partial [Pyrinomonadaceae bacterium]